MPNIFSLNSPTPWGIAGYVFRKKGIYTCRWDHQCSEKLTCSIHPSTKWHIPILISSFFGYTHGVWKLPGQELKVCHSSNLSHCMDSAGSLTCWAGTPHCSGFNLDHKRTLVYSFYFCMMFHCMTISLFNHSSSMDVWTFLEFDNPCSTTMNIVIHISQCTYNLFF